MREGVGRVLCWVSHASGFAQHAILDYIIGYLQVNIPDQTRVPVLAASPHHDEPHSSSMLAAALPTLLLLVAGAQTERASETSPYACSAENPDLVAWLQRRLQSVGKVLCC